MAGEKGPLSGFRDFHAKELLQRKEMLNTIEGIYQRYGFTPLETPALERLETLQGKYGDEADKLIYQFKDNGGRNVAMRYDMTVPLARVVNQYRGKIPIPFKRYTYGNVWRGESPQHGRYREFMQFDADTVGTRSPLADAEIVGMMSDAMTALGVNSVIKVNDRRILDGLAQSVGIEDEREKLRLIGLIDKKDKVKEGEDSVVTQIGKRFSVNAGQIVERYLGITGSEKSMLSQLQSLLGNTSAEQGIASLTNIFDLIRAAGFKGDDIVFDPTVARGLDYYTGTIYETTLTGLPSIGSVCSGGRFDNLVSDIGGEDLPGVGTSIGVDRLFAGLETLDQLKVKNFGPQVLIANFDTVDPKVYFELAHRLREAGISTNVYFDADKMNRQFKFAKDLGTSFVVMVGPNELAQNQVTLVEMGTNQRHRVELKSIESVIEKSLS